MGWLYDIYFSSYVLAVYSLFRCALSGILFLSAVVYQLELGANVQYAGPWPIAQKHNALPKKIKNKK